MKHLTATGEFQFDLSLDGPRLRPVLFGSRSNLPYESNYHSFVGDGARERCSIATCRKYILGFQFYWLCDCIVVNEVLEYNSSTNQLKSWSHELLAYEFACIHRTNKMMNDVDRIYRHTDPFIHRYLWDAATMHSKDIHLQPFVYNFDIFSSYSNPRHVSSADATSSHDTVPILPTLSIFYHYPISFSSELSTSSFAIINSLSPSISVLPDNITWLSFESVLNSVEDHLSVWVP